MKEMKSDAREYLILVLIRVKGIQDKLQKFKEKLVNQKYATLFLS